jgi:NADPH:quinone reductase-like Zn-dependent oxidoreductase
MRAYRINDYGSFAGLVLRDEPQPQPGPNEILVRMRAASLNYRDLMVVKGTYSAKPRPNLVPLSDGSGEVVAVGSEVLRWKAGDRVAGNFFQTWVAGSLTREKMKSALGGDIDGALAEYVVFHQDGLVALPDGLTYEEGASLPCAAVTAWHAVQRSGLTSGDTILLLGTGGVSIFALQFAKALGARVIITSSSDHKLEKARVLGAHETINYRSTPEWETVAFKLTNRTGVDQVIEVGGNDTFEKSLRSLRIGGTLSMIGGVSGFGGQVNPFPILFGSLNVHGIYVGSVAMFEAMNRALQVDKIKPVIDRVFSFEEARDAYVYLESGAHFGKVVIAIH